MLRSGIHPDICYVIPNAVDAKRFEPDPTQRPNVEDRINIVVMSRLTLRKGVALLAQIIPPICKEFPNAYWIIGGDGGSRLMLEEMIEKYQLHDRVEMLGAVPHNQVRNVLTRGHVYVNPSLTEAFCIAIVEAACCGILIFYLKVETAYNCIIARDIYIFLFDFC